MSKSFKIWDYFILLLFPKDSKNLKKIDIALWKVGAKRLLIGVRNTNTKKNQLIKARFAQKLTSLRDNFTPFISNGSKSLRLLDIQLWEVGAKKTFKRYLKSEQTHRHTDTHMDKSSYRKHAVKIYIRKRQRWRLCWNRERKWH